MPCQNLEKANHTQFQEKPGQSDGTTEGQNDKRMDKRTDERSDKKRNEGWEDPIP